MLDTAVQPEIRREQRPHRVVQAAIPTKNVETPLVSHPEIVYQLECDRRSRRGKVVMRLECC